MEGTFTSHQSEILHSLIFLVFNIILEIFKWPHSNTRTYAQTSGKKVPLLVQTARVKNSCDRQKQIKVDRNVRLTLTFATMTSFETEHVLPNRNQILKHRIYLVGSNILEQIEILKKGFIPTLQFWEPF